MRLQLGLQLRRDRGHRQAERLGGQTALPEEEAFERGGTGLLEQQPDEGSQQAEGGLSLLESALTEKPARLQESLRADVGGGEHAACKGSRSGDRERRARRPAVRLSRYPAGPQLVIIRGNGFPGRWRLSSAAWPKSEKDRHSFFEGMAIFFDLIFRRCASPRQSGG